MAPTRNRHGAKPAPGRRGVPPRAIRADRLSEPLGGRLGGTRSRFIYRPAGWRPRTRPAVNAYGQTAEVLVLTRSELASIPWKFQESCLRVGRTRVQ